MLYSTVHYDKIRYFTIPNCKLYICFRNTTRRDFHSTADSTTFHPPICDPIMANLSKTEREVCDKNAIKDGLDGFLREFELKFRSSG